MRITDECDITVSVKSPFVQRPWNRKLVLSGFSVLPRLYVVPLKIYGCALRFSTWAPNGWCLVLAVSSAQPLPSARTPTDATVFVALGRPCIQTQPCFREIFFLLWPLSVSFSFFPWPLCLGFRFIERGFVAWLNYLTFCLYSASPVSGFLI